MSNKSIENSSLKLLRRKIILSVIPTLNLGRHYTSFDSNMRLDSRINQYGEFNRGKNLMFN
jgi:hypothetical protein